MDVASFDYDLPPAAIAQEAIEPRDAARLLITSDLSEMPFRELPTLFDSGDLLVVNTTRVRAARLEGSRIPSGGRVEVLLVRRNDDATWQVMLRPSRRLRGGDRIAIGDRSVTLVNDPEGGVATVTLEPSDGAEEFIARHGAVPLPPYFTGRLEDAERYQTMFAAPVGSAAAPTAALHFTPRVVEELSARGIDIAGVTLDVGLDTFRPMDDGRVEDHEIHTERIHVPEETATMVNETHRAGGRVVAVGTTVARTLESAAVDDGVIAPIEGPTSLFIVPGYRPRVIDGLITNFHAPRTTLLVLLAALMGDRWREAYGHALGTGFRFLSFGDAMYVDVVR